MRQQRLQAGAQQQVREEQRPAFHHRACSTACAPVLGEESLDHSVAEQWRLLEWLHTSCSDTPLSLLVGATPALAVFPKRSDGTDGKGGHVSPWARSSAG